ncbi:hypothetical protein ACLB1N_19515 [Escherichia coli]
MERDHAYTIVCDEHLMLEWVGADCVCLDLMSVHCELFIMSASFGQLANMVVIPLWAMWIVMMESTFLLDSLGKQILLNGKGYHPISIPSAGKRWIEPD